MNAFLDLADRQIAAPRKAQARAAETRAARRAVADQQLSAAYRRWREERLEALLAGPLGDAARGLIEFLNGMTLHDGAALVAAAETWRGADGETRHKILALIDTAVVTLRERHGLPPYDDSLPGEPLNVFLLIRGALS